MNAPEKPSRLGRGIMYFCIGLAIGGFFYLIITSGWRSSLRESQWLVQKQWAINEREWLALEEIGRRLVQRKPRAPEGWDALITSALARGNNTRAQELLTWVRQGLPAHEPLWSQWEAQIASQLWQPPPTQEPDTLPALGEPRVRATAILANRPVQGCVTVTFDRPVYTFLVSRAATYLNETTGRSVIGRLSEPDTNPEVEKLQITFCPTQPLPPASTHRFVFDMPQERPGGAWFVYPLVLEIPDTRQTDHETVR